MPSPEKEFPNIDFFITIFPYSNKDGVNLDTDIKSWSQPVKSLKDLLERR